MADQITNIQRGGQQTTVEDKLPEGKTPDFQSSVQVEEPFTAYKGNRPEKFLVDYFELGDEWNDAVGGYPREIEAISEYLSKKVRSGDIADDQKVIREKIKTMLRTNNLLNEPRASVRLPVLASYVKFLAETDGAKRNTSRI